MEDRPRGMVSYFEGECPEDGRTVSVLLYGKFPEHCWIRCKGCGKVHRGERKERKLERKPTI